VTDSHAHLDACDEPAATLVERARAAGVARIVTIGTGIESSRAALAIAEAHEGVSAALGIDPHQAGGAEAERLGELRELLAHPKAVAVGETGLDTVRADATQEEQRRLLDAHLALARDCRLPVVIHNREADEETAAALGSVLAPVVGGAADGATDGAAVAVGAAVAELCPQAASTPPALASAASDMNRRRLIWARAMSC